MVKLRCLILKINPKEPFMSIVNTLALESNRQIKINFDGGDLSSDAGLLLIKEFISKLGIDTLLEKAFKTNDPVFKSVLKKDALASQPTVSRFFNRMEQIKRCMNF